MSTRVYFDRYTRYNSELWHWQPYIYNHNCSLEEQKEWNELYLNTRGRKEGNDKVMPDFYSIERDANQFGLIEATFTDIFGLKWSGKKGCTEEVSSPDYKGSLYYWSCEDDEDVPMISEYDKYDNVPDVNIYYKFNVGHPRWRNEWIDIANIDNLEYIYFVENHLFKDSVIEIHYKGDEEYISYSIYDCHDFTEFVYALKQFGKESLLRKLYEKIDEHFEALKNSSCEEDREYYPNCTAEQYFEKRLLERKM